MRKLKVVFMLIALICLSVQFQGCNLEVDLIEESVEPYIKAQTIGPEVSCPIQDIVEWFHSPSGSAVIQTEKNFYCEENHSIELFMQGQGWVTVEEYEAWLAEVEEEQKAQDSI